jgi:uncharacterized oxidoreductase
MDLNVLINNAGIQWMIDFKKGTEDLIRYRAIDGEDEIDVNLRSLVYMTALFTPHLMKQKEAAIMNVTSGLAFHPMRCFRSILRPKRRSILSASHSGSSWKALL